MNINIPLFLRSKRKSLGLSVDEVLNGLKENNIPILSSKTIYGWESGHSQPSVEAFMALLRIYGVSSLSEVVEYVPLSSFDDDVLALCHQLNEEGREKVLDYLDDLVSSRKYIKNRPNELDQEA